MALTPEEIERYKRHLELREVGGQGQQNIKADTVLVIGAGVRVSPQLTYLAGPGDGFVTTLKPHETGPDGQPFPSYRCIFPEPPPPGTVANCAEVGVLGAAVGVIGTLQATEVLKEIVGIGEGLAGRLLLYDARSARFNEIRIAWDPANPLSGKTPTVRDLAIHAAAPQGAVCAA